jgi:hypothetical protein
MVFKGTPTHADIPVNTALRKHLDPKRFSVVTAGDFKK